MLNSLTLYIFIFEIERIRLFFSEPEKHKYEEKREKIKAILFVVIVSLVIQSLSVSLLNYEMHLSRELYSEFVKLCLSLSSAALKLITDFYIFWIAIRGIWYLFSEY